MIGAFWQWQPIAYDFFPPPLPPKSKVDPAEQRLFAKGTKVLVITAHPDDSEFYMAPFLMRLKDSGAILNHVLHTDGDKAFYFWQDNSGLHDIRRGEQTTASRMWGAQELVFLGYPDGRLRKNSDTIDRTVQQIVRFQPDYIVAFDAEFAPQRQHQDHRVSGEIVTAAVRKAGFKGWVLGCSTRAPNYVADGSAYFAWQRKLVAIHKSQFSGERLERIVRMTEGRILEAGEPYGYQAGIEFRAVRLTPR